MRGIVEVGWPLTTAPNAYGTDSYAVGDAHPTGLNHHRLLLDGPSLALEIG
jgi:hypothetical protein